MNERMKTRLKGKSAALLVANDENRLPEEIVKVGQECTINGPIEVFVYGKIMSRSLRRNAGGSAEKQLLLFKHSDMETIKIALKIVGFHSGSGKVFHPAVAEALCGT